MSLAVANGLEIPYIGNLELDVELCGKLLPVCGIGFASYHRRIVKGFPKLAAPLQKLVAELAGLKPNRADQTGHWMEGCCHRFEALKTRLTTAPVLAYAGFTLPFILEVDTSYVGLGDVLSQEQDGKLTRAVV